MQTRSAAIGYTRVSTSLQASSGLGLAAQREAIERFAASEGFTIEASELGKLKMVVQIVSVVATILALRWDTWYFNLRVFSFVLDVDLVARMAIWFMVAVSVISAVDYFWGFWNKIDKRVERRRRRPFILSRRKKKALQEAEANNPAKVH